MKVLKWQHLSLLCIALGDDVSESGSPGCGSSVSGCRELGKVKGGTLDVQKVCSVMNPDNIVQVL